MHTPIINHTPKSEVLLRFMYSYASLTITQHYKGRTLQETFLQWIQLLWKMQVKAWTSQKKSHIMLSLIDTSCWLQKELEHTEVKWLVKRHVSGQNDIKQWKTSNPIGYTHCRDMLGWIYTVSVSLLELISQKKFHRNLGLESLWRYFWAWLSAKL